MTARHLFHLPRARRRLVAAVAVVALAGIGVGPAAVLLAEPAAAATGSLILDDDFRGTTTDPEFIGLGDACLTAAPQVEKQTPGSHELGGCARISAHGEEAMGKAPTPGLSPGYLQLTDARNNETGAALYNQPIPSEGGLDITFAQYQYGGGGPNNLRADGIGFFLTDGRTELTEAGGWGGSLGYAQSYDQSVHRDGVRGGYVGIGLDGFGNFVNDGFGKGAGCTPPVGSPSPVSPPAGYNDLVPDTVGIRGPGEGRTGYCYLAATIERRSGTGTTTPAPGQNWITTLPGDLTAATLASATRYVHITISPEVHPLITVSIDFDGPGDAGYQEVLSYRMPVAAPPTYKFGFAASTGGNTNVHLIRGLRVESIAPLHQLNLVKQIDRSHDQPDRYGAGAEIPYEFVVTNTGLTTLTGLTVTDALVPEITCPETTLAPAGQPGSSVVCRGSHMVTADEAAQQTLTNTAVAHTAQANSNESEVTVPMTAHPAIALEKTATGITRDGVTTAGPAQVGDEITYGFTVRNAGNVPLTGVSLTDSRLDGLDCEDSTLDVGGETTCTADPYTVTDADVQHGEVVNTATASGLPPTGPRVEAPDHETVPTVVGHAGIAVVKHATLHPADDENRTIAHIGDTVTYTFTVKNTGTLTLHTVGVTDTKAGAVTCSAGTLAPGASTTCTAVAPYTVVQDDVDAGGVKNTATAHGTPSGATTPVEANDDETVPTPAQDPAILLTKTATIPGGRDVAQVGDVITYTFTVENKGSVTLHDVTVTDPSLTGDITCEATTLAPTAATTCTGASHTITSSDPSPFPNTATATGHPTTGDPVTSTDTRNVPVFVAAPSLSLDKRADREIGDPLPGIGDTIDYSYTVTNDGDVALAGLSVTDDRITGVQCPAGPLAVGAIATCTGSYVVTQADVDAGRVVNVATATAGEVESNKDTETVPTVPEVAGISIVKSLASDTPLPPGIGDTLTFDLVVTNTGTVPLSPVLVTDPLADDVDCPDDTLAVGAWITCTATLTVTQAQVLAGEVHNTATATGTPPGGSGLDDATHEDDETVATVDPVAALVVEKQAEVPGEAPGVVAVGDTVKYSYLVTNRGTLPVTDVAVEDDRVAAVDCPDGTLEPATSVTCTASHVVTQDEVDAGHVANAATASGTDPNGDDVTSNRDEEDVRTVPANPALQVRKAATLHDGNDNGLADLGERVTYEYVVTSTGNVSVHAVRVVDAVGDTPVAVHCPSGTLAPGDSVTCTASWTVTQSDVDTGEVANVATAHGTDPGGTRVTSPEDRAYVTADARWDLSVSKTASLEDTDGDGLASVGEVVTFVATATNTGTTTLTDVVVDDLDAPATCTADVLPPGRSVTCTARHTTTLADLQAGQVRDRAVQIATTPFGYVVGGEVHATAPTVPAPPRSLAPTGAEVEQPGGAALAAIVLGSLLAWTGSRLRRTPARP